MAKVKKLPEHPAWTHGITVIQNMTETQLREEVSRLKDTIDAQKKIINDIVQITNKKKVLFDILRYKIKELKETNKILLELVPSFEPADPESNSYLRY